MSTILPPPLPCCERRHHSILAASILAVSIATALLPGLASAQQSSADTTELDRVAVTGSRIRQVDVETAQPITLMSRTDIQRQGFQSVTDILQSISALGTPPLTRAQPLSSGETRGGQYISLRNLGSERSLVLLNGRRLGINTEGSQDIAAIPVAAIERIEVLKDGASSIYGSDAIAGVVNIITRHNFDGAEANLYHGQFTQGDGAVTSGSLTVGASGERGSIVLTAEYRREDGVDASDRWFSAFPRTKFHPTDGWTTVGQFGGFAANWSQRGLFPHLSFTAPTANNSNPTTRLVVRDGGDPRNLADWVVQNTNTGRCPQGASPVDCIPGSTEHKSNAQLQMAVQTPVETKSIFTDTSYDLNERIRFRGGLSYFQRIATGDIAGYPMQANSFDTPMHEDSYFNPTGSTISNWWRRTWEVPRTTRTELDNIRFTGGLEGDFQLGGRIFDWDVGYLYSEHSVTQRGLGNLNLANTRNAVGPSFLNVNGVVQCGTAASPIPLDQCTPFNPFVPYGVEAPGSLTGNKPLQDYLFQSENSSGTTRTQVFAATLSGTLATFPLGGDLGFALGVESREEEGNFTPDALAVTGGSTTLAAGPTSGKYRVDEIFLEAELPLLASLPWAQELTLTAASRYSDYTTFGDTTNNKFGLRWRPIDTLLVRATVADGFRAPTIKDLYGGGSQTFSSFTDPCDTSFGSSATNPETRARCAADLGALADTYRQIRQGGTAAASGNTQTPVAFTSGANPNLQPEESKSQTVGFVWSPGFAEGLSIGMDWWKIRIGNTIVDDSPTDMLNDCYIQGIASRCAASVGGAPGFTRDMNQGGIPVVQFASRNSGFRKAEGIDMDVSYRWNHVRFGNFSVQSSSTYTLNDYAVTTNDPRHALSSVGVAGRSRTTFRLRSNLGLGWNYGDFSANWNLRYYSGMQESCTYFTAQPQQNGVPTAAPIMEAHHECNNIRYAPTGVINADGSLQSELRRRRKVGSTTFNDVQFSWQAPWEATVSVGANNVFGHYGPIMYTQPSANFAYYGGFDIGRFVYVKYQQRF